ILAGVTPTQPGWTRFAFAPTTDDPRVNRVNAEVPTPEGLVQAGWAREKNQTTIHLVVPPGTQAEVTLPDRTNHTVAAGRHEWSVA
ncbi:MAG: alpha-L-rhamnosidase C-terminal domain-containing protein, partial [Planctomycetota bacterium]